MVQYIFRKIRRDEIPQMFSLILRRIEWMDANGIKQWNVTNYTEVYPIEYYYKKYEEGVIFALIEENGTLVCAAILQEKDKRWKDNSPAIYLHNFVSQLGRKGVGTIFLNHAADYALHQKKKYFRLDSATDNYSLAQYYESQGFLPVGECQDGLYRGVLRQKLLEQ